MKPCILYRRMGSRSEDDAEIHAAHQAGFDVYEHRSLIPKGSLVIGRYSVLPFYRELERDLESSQSMLINSGGTHEYIADLGNWYEDLKDLTPKTWNRLEDIPDNGGPFVLKGETNSRKDRWNELMFAKTKTDAIQVALRLQADGLIGTQKLYIREFEPFYKIGEAVGGAPVTLEYRFFCLYGRVLCGGFYWSSHTDLLAAEGSRDSARLQKDAQAFVQHEVLPRVEATFVVVDVARHEDGRWRVVELNDGQMSGLSTIPPAELYTSLRRMVLPQVRLSTSGVPDEELAVLKQQWDTMMHEMGGGWRAPVYLNPLPPEIPPCPRGHPGSQLWTIGAEGERTYRCTECEKLNGKGLELYQYPFGLT